MSTEQILEACERHKNGESQPSLAKEFGVTRQYISLIYKRYREKGPEAFAARYNEFGELVRRGKRKVPPLGSEHIEALREAIDSGKTPYQIGVPKEKNLEDTWNLRTGQLFIRMKFGFIPKKGDMADLLEGWGYYKSGLSHLVVEGEAQPATVKKPRRGRPPGKKNTKSNYLGSSLPSLEEMERTLAEHGIHIPKDEE